MTSPLESILEAALAGATRAAAREIRQRVTSGLESANAAIDRARIPLRIAQAGLDAVQANLDEYAALAATALNDDDSSPPR